MTLHTIPAQHSTAWQSNRKNSPRAVAVGNKAANTSATPRDTGEERTHPSALRLSAGSFCCCAPPCQSQSPLLTSGLTAAPTLNRFKTGGNLLTLLCFQTRAVCAAQAVLPYANWQLLQS